MEIPVIGRFFKKASPVTEVQRPVQLDSYRPKVRKDVVGESLLRRSRDSKNIEEVKRFLMEPTEETFVVLSYETAESPVSRKFVRSGDKIIIAEGGAHVYVALAGGMREVDDAGYIEQKENGGRFLFVTGGSEGLHIGDRNENRPATVDLLRRLAPSFTFEEKPPR